MTWENRITGTGEEAPDQLLANPRNWRIHPRAQREALAGVLREVGVVQEVIVNRQTGHLLDGHLRVDLAIEEEQDTVPVKYVDLTLEEEAEVLATFDPLSTMAVTDPSQLGALLGDVHSGEEGVQQLLAELGDDSGPYSPNLNPDMSMRDVDAGDMDKAQGKINPSNGSANMLEVICPHCGEEFEVSG